MPKIVECVPNFSEGRDREVRAKYVFIFYDMEILTRKLFIFIVDF